MNLPTVVFGKTVCRITDPDPAWFQRSPDDPLECSQCGDTLTFTFLPRTNPQTAGFAGSYSVPTGNRGHASVILSSLFAFKEREAATDKQKSYCHFLGHPDPCKLTKREAARWIGAHK